MSELNNRQTRFCEEYLIDFNATQAAIRQPLLRKVIQKKLSALDKLVSFHTMFYTVDLTENEMQMCFRLAFVLADKASYPFNKAAAALGLDLLLPEWREVTPKQTLGAVIERQSKEVSAWKRSCLQRDSHTCNKCGTKENLAVHHILSWVGFPELRLMEDNGEVLCGLCHSKEHPKMGLGMFVRQSKIDKVDNGTKWN